MKFIAYTFEGTFYEVLNVEMVRLVSINGKTDVGPPVYTLEVKQFDKGSEIHRGLKGYQHIGGTHELKG